jgi:hypothetical protein
MTLDANTHRCPACREVQVPRNRCVCRTCWSLAPSRLRESLTYAYASRISSPAEYREALVGFLEWARDQRTGGFSNV